MINVVGSWMLELRDRYSYFHMLLPLLLTGYTDDIEEIREATDALWWDVGESRRVKTHGSLPVNLFFRIEIRERERRGSQRSNQFLSETVEIPAEL